jgi:hypothetical protein
MKKVVKFLSFKLIPLKLTLFLHTVQKPTRALLSRSKIIIKSWIYSAGFLDTLFQLTEEVKVIV